MSTDKTLQLPEEISIVNIGEWKDTLIDELQSSSSIITLDASDLCRVDTAAIQLLAAFVTEAISSGKELKWQARSEALSATAQQLGLDQQLLLNQ